MAERELTWDLNTKAGKAVSDIQKVDKEVDKLKTNMMAVDKQSGALGKIAGGFAAAGSRMQNIGAGMQSVGSGISNVSGKIATAGTRMTAMAAPVALAFKKGVDGALELDTAIRQVTTLADQDVLPVSKIESEVRRISDATGIAQKEISESMYEALSSGIDSADVVGFVEQGVQLTKAGFTDMPTVIDATTTALNAYGLQGAEATSHIQDVMVKTQDLGKITVDELGKNIGRVVPFASAAGVSIDQLGAGYSVLTAKGQNAAIATTNLSALISELNTTGSTADKALRKSMGQSFKEMMDDGKSLGDVLQSLDGIAQEQGLNLGDMFGNKMATSAANTLLADGPGQFNNALDAMVNSGGSVEANFDKMQGPAEKLRQTQNKLKNSFIEMGAAMTPVFEQFASGIQKIADKFNSLDDGTKEIIGKVALVMTVAGPILAIIGTIGGAIGGIISVVGTVVGLIGSAVSAIGGAISSAGGAIALLTGPIGMVVGAIVGAITVGYLLYNNWDMIKAKAVEVWDGISLKISETVESIKLKIDEFKMAATEKFEGFKIAANEKLGGIKSKASEMASGMAGAISGAIGTAKGMFNSLKSTATSAIEGIKSAWNRMKEVLSKPINAVVNFGKGIVNGAKNLISGNSHADGLYRVPYDEYPAMLHKDEMVVTAQGSNQLRSMGANENGFSNPPTGSMMGDLRPSVTNNESSTSNNSSFSPVINVTVNGNGNASDANHIADVVKEELMQLFMTANLQRG
ncbi:phage tail tape measure protein [uncultured Anaerococcus sp.]|uniref:phage tail tape measure protein n=1 Tax=uncultured Anaerococcus sp. TaxID=293428 RepID=UPI0025F4CFBB|nr:phage tail tape measure protein [uncultured Anaerococcus sp.]